MAGLRLGPLLRYVDWETRYRDRLGRGDRPCTAEVRCADGARRHVPAPSRSPGTTTRWCR